MKNRVLVSSALILTILLSYAWSAGAAEKPESAAPSDLLVVSGTITNAQGKAIKEVQLHFYVNGKKIQS